MIDYRQIYLFRIHKRGRTVKARKSIAVRLPFAGWHERQLHKRFAPDRYSDVRRIPWHQFGQGVVKIGISTDADRRRKEFERNPASGKTETFALSAAQRTSARNLIIGYWIRWQLIRWGGVAAVVLWLLGEPWVDWLF
jgi:hypothetical protein